MQGSASALRIGGAASPPPPPRPATFADVAMRLVNDGPIYAAVFLVGVLSLKGQASASEMVITSLAALLARSWPRAVQVASSAGVIVFFGARAALSLYAPADVAALSRPPESLIVVPSDVRPAPLSGAVEAR
jgi:hypothetical protein